MGTGQEGAASAQNAADIDQGSVLCYGSAHHSKGGRQLCSAGPEVCVHTTGSCLRNMQYYFTLSFYVLKARLQVPSTSFVNGTFDLFDVILNGTKNGAV